MPKIRERLGQFLSGYSDNSKRAYSKAIADWLEYRSEGRWFTERALTHVKQIDAHTYLKRLSERPGIKDDWGNAKASSNTVTQRHAILRKFYGYLMSMGDIAAPNPFDIKFEVQESRKREYDRLSDEQVSAFLMCSDVTTVEGRRNHAIMCVLFGLGLRRSEIPDLAINDFTEKNGMLLCRIRVQKSKKLSVIPVPTWAAEAILACRQDRIDSGAAESAPLFVKIKGDKQKKITPISDQIIRRLFAAYRVKAKIHGSFTPHCARATAITKALEAGYNYKEVREFSRHSSMRMVEVYDKRRMELGDSPSMKIDYAPMKKHS